MKFKNYIETESGIKDTSTSPGTAGQVLSSTVTGTSWIDPDTLVSAASKLVVISCKNVSGAQILKGTPVYQSGTVGATDVIEVEPADATISTGYLPAIGILQTTLNNNGFGNVVITGEFLNYSTADIPTDRPGGDPFTGDTVYLAAGGGLTCIKPTGAGNAIQNVGLIGKVSGGNSGSITVSSIMRANDVPNLPEGRIWIGDGNTIVSDTVYVDEPNSRVGINTAMPTYDLDVDGAIRASEGFIDNEDNSALRVVSPPGGSFRSAFTTVGAIEVTIPNSYVKNDVTFTLEVREGGLTAYTIKIAMRGNIGIDLFPYVVSAYLTSDANKDNNCTIKYESLVPEFDDVKIYVQNPSLGFPSNTGVFITEFTVPATVADGNLAWGLNITSVPAEANATFSNTQVTNWKRNGQDLYYGSGSGNVGIGTTSPGTYRLAVAGSTAIGENLEVSDGLGGDKTLSIDATIGAFQIGDIDGIGDGAHIEGDSSNIKIFTGSVEKVRVNLSGNVGIGTPAPLAKLQVDGNANIGLLHTNFAGASFNVNLGFENYNNGFAAIATGQNTLADASQSFSMGFQSKATGAASLAGGNVNIITALPSESAGEASIAFGNGVKTNSNANYSQAFGRGTETGGGLTSANQAMAMGFNSIAFGDNSFSGGNNSRAFGEASFAFGEGAVGSKGDGNIALGIGVTTPNNGSAAYSSGQVAVGTYNVWGTGQPLSFSVGNGFSDSQRLTALCVNRNTGNTGMGNVFNPQSKLQVNGGIQLAFDGSTPSLAKVGTFRYRKSGNNSYVDMCMQTGASTYAWVNIVTNSW